MGVLWADTSISNFKIELTAGHVEPILCVFNVTVFMLKF